ncbi:NAD-dependent epimerase/dehydratase family protein, partial [bacterium]
MDIRGKTVLVLGGWGLVGSAICRKFMEEKPRRIIVTSLSKNEAIEAVDALQTDYPRAGKNFFVPWWGNIFVREELKDIPREEIIGNEKYRTMIIEDVVDELTGPVLTRSSLHRLLMRYKPEVVVDCVNSATGIAYQDIFQVSRELIKQIQKSRVAKKSKAPLDYDLIDAAERLLCT